ncbi:hypothetical protein C8R43DRAFT_1137191 [Mycena crocata]|nr:hypothetical protein C8R43DRAFT_1137191 [Mycena crocata]
MLFQRLTFLLALVVFVTAVPVVQTDAIIAGTDDNLVDEVNAMMMRRAEDIEVENEVDIACD